MILPRRTIQIALLLVVTYSANAQCNLTSFKTESTTANVTGAGFELLFKAPAKDYAGLVTVRGRLFTMVYPKETNKHWGLEIALEAKKNSLVVPRTVTFFFKNGEILSVAAESFRQFEGAILSSFTPYDTLLKALKTQPIKEIFLFDKRTNTLYTGVQKDGLYPGVLAEQLRCLE